MPITLRSRLALLTLAASAALVIGAAPMALAGPLDGVGNTVSDTVGGATGTANNTVGNVNDTAGQMTGGANDTVNNNVGNVNDTVGQTAGNANDTVNNTVGNVNDTVGQTTGGGNNVNDTVGNVTDTAGGTTGGVVDGVGEVPGGGTGGGAGGTVGGITDSVNELTTGVTHEVGQTVHESFGNTGVGDAGSHIVDGVLGNETRRSGELASSGGTIDGKKVSQTAPGGVAPGTAGNSVLGEIVDGFAGSNPTLFSQTTGSPEHAQASFWKAAADAATEAAKRLAFPALLLALVGAFLLLHGRVGRKDPKLALAPVEADHDALAFE